MALIYDQGSGQFILQTATTLKRFDAELEPTIEDAFAAFEILSALRRSVEKKLDAAIQRPDPLGLKAAVEDYLATGGHAVVSTYDPVKKAAINRLKPQAINAASGEELLAILGLGKKS